MQPVPSSVSVMMQCPSNALSQCLPRLTIEPAADNCQAANTSPRINSTGMRRDSAWATTSTACRMSDGTTPCAAYGKVNAGPSSVSNPGKMNVRSIMRPRPPKPSASTNHSFRRSTRPPNSTSTASLSPPLALIGILPHRLPLPSEGRGGGHLGADGGKDEGGRGEYGNGGDVWDVSGT